MLTIRSLLFTLSLFLSSLIGGTLVLLIFWAPFPGSGASHVPGLATTFGQVECFAACG